MLIMQPRLQPNSTRSAVPSYLTTHSLLNSPGIRPRLPSWLRDPALLFRRAAETAIRPPVTGSPPIGGAHHRMPIQRGQERVNIAGVPTCLTFDVLCIVGAHQRPYTSRVSLWSPVSSSADWNLGVSPSRERWCRHDSDLRHRPGERERVIGHLTGKCGQSNWDFIALMCPCG
jgi:hypothetical protein